MYYRICNFFANYLISNIIFMSQVMVFHLFNRPGAGADDAYRLLTNM